MADVTHEDTAPAVYTPGQVAELFQVHISTVYTWINEGRIPVVAAPLKRQKRIPKEWVDAKLAEATVETSDDSRAADTLDLTPNLR